MRTNVENSKLVEEAFSKQAAVFDEEYKDDIIVRYKRGRVREHLEEQLKPHSKILELNAGTGDDAIYLAKKGHFIHCTDASGSMLEQLEKKVQKEGLTKNITSQKCSFLDLLKIDPERKYDHIFSNFGGLNCTNELDKVLNSFDRLLTPQGGVTLVIMPKFCLWENLLSLKGNFKTAFRRYSNNGASSHVEGVHFTSWYYHPDYIISHLENNFVLTKLEGLCTLVPPSYLKNFPKKQTRLYNLLIKSENRLKSKSPWKYWGYYFIISLKKK